MPIPSFTNLTLKESNRQAWGRRKATALMYTLHGRRPFADVWNRIARRWPVACGQHPGFKDELQSAWEKESLLNAEWRIQEDTRRLSTPPSRHPLDSPPAS
jgi:hypothetical protein